MSPSGLARLGSDRVALMSGRFLFLLERGQPFINDGRHHLDARDVDPHAGFKALVLRPNGELVVLATIYSDGEDSVGLRSALVRVRVDGGSLTKLEPPTPIDIPLDQLALDHSGLWIGAHETGAVLTSTSVFGPFDRVRTDESEVHAIVTSDLEGAPHWLGGESDYFFGDLRVDPRLTRSERIHWLSSQVRSIAVRSSGPPYTGYVGGRQGRMAQFVSEKTTPLNYHVPQAGVGCAEPTSCDGRLVRSSINDLALHDDWLLAVVDDCNMLLTFRVSDGCTGVLSDQDLVVNDRDQAYEVMNVSEGVLTIGGDAGLVLQAELP